MDTNFHLSLPPGRLRVGLIEAHDLTVAPSPPEYLQAIATDVQPVLAPEFAFPDHLQKGIRSLLKSYGFHPSGRNRPASEYLVKDLQGRGSFFAINNVVDINNHISLLSHLPISVFDLDLTGTSLCARLGMDGEKYVFNKEGHELALRDLVVTARTTGDQQAVGSPIKDSHATKIQAATRRALGVIYTATTLTPADELERWLSRFADLLRRYAGAQTCEWAVLDAPQ
jgi:DNA/RNA-binding domain of Phe-tRNA-synthetase-like protein